MDSTYPEADCHIPATPALLAKWCGPAEIRRYPDPWSPIAWDAATEAMVEGMEYQLDPFRPEARDHLIRRLFLPDWMRDGVGLSELWQSAGLIACSASGVIPKEIVPVWVHEYADRWTRRDRAVSSGTLDGWWLYGTAPFTIRGGERGEAGKAAADAAALAQGWALMQDKDTMILPWSGGPRIWRRP